MVQTCQWIPTLATESRTHHSYKIHFNISLHLFYSIQMVLHLEISQLTHCLHFLIPSTSPTNPILHHLIIRTSLQHHGSYIHISMTQIWWPLNRTTLSVVCVCACVHVHTHARTHCSSLKLYSISDRRMNTYGALME
jgi:hypothetical protein